MMKVFFYTFLFLLLFVSPVFADNAIFSDAFTFKINSFIRRIVGGGNEVYVFVGFLLAFLSFLTIFAEITKFMVDGFDPFSIWEAFFTLCVTYLLWFNYPLIVDTLWDVADNLGLSIQEIATGSRDGFFLSTWTRKVFNSIVIEKGILTALTGAVVLLMWYLVSGLLQFAMYIVGLWVVWSGAVAKIIGLIFVPFLAHKGTRNLFDSWVRFFAGFLVLLIVLRITGTIAALSLESQMQDMGLACVEQVGALCQDGKWATKIAPGVIMASAWPIVMVLCSILIFSSFGFAAALVSGIGSTSSGVVNAGRRIATKIISKLL